MHPAPLSILGDLGLQELLLVALASVVIFGKRLPQVAARGYAEFQRVRRTLTQMWRETGIEEEIRRVQRDLERAVPRDLDPAAIARQRTRELEQSFGRPVSRRAPAPEQDGDAAARAAAPASEAPTDPSAGANAPGSPTDES